MKVLGSSLKRAVAWARENVEYAPFLAFLVLVGFIQVSFGGLFILLKIALLIVLAAGCTIAYVILHDGPAIARAAAAAKLTGDTVVIPEPRSNVARQVAPKAPMELPSTVETSRPAPSSPAYPGPDLELDEPPLVIPSGKEGHLMTWAELTQAGLIAPALHFYVGFDVIAERPILVGWDRSTGSMIFCGGSQSGKTVSVTSWCAQAVAKARRPCLIICDTDMGNVKSLTNRLQPLRAAFLEPPAKSPEAILERLRRLESLMDERSDHEAEHGPQVWDPVRAVVEEWPSLMSGKNGHLAKELTEVVTHLARRGFKYGIEVGLCTQDGTVGANGSVQGVVTSYMVHRNGFAETRYLTGQHVDVSSYTDGMAFLKIRDETWERAKIPMVTPADLAPIVALIRRPEPLVAPSGSPAGSDVVPPGPLAAVVPIHRGAGSQPVAAVPLLPEKVSPEDAERILDGFYRGGRSMADLAKSVLDAPDHGGALTRKIGLVSEVIRLAGDPRGLAGTSAATPPPSPAGTGSGTGAPADPHGRTGGSPRLGGAGQPSAGADRGTGGQAGAAGDEDAGT